MSEKPRLMYENEILAYYGIAFDSENYAELTDKIKELYEKGIFHPKEIQKAIINSAEVLDKYNLSDADVEKFNLIFDASFPFDATTGYYAIETLPVMVGTAYCQAQSIDEPIVLVEADITTMGGGNIILGKDDMDKLINEIARITEEKLAEAGYHDAIRAGGDEMQWTIHGVPKEKIDKILQLKVMPEVHKLTSKLSLVNIDPTKLNELKFNGISITYGSSELKGKDPTEIRKEINEQITNEKKIDGFLRFGLINETKVNDYIERVLKPYYKNTEQTITDEEIAEKRKQLLEVVMPQIKQRWEEILNENPELKEEYNKSNHTNSYNFFISQGNIAERIIILGIKEMEDSNPKPLFEEEKAKIPKVEEIRTSKRLRTALSSFGFEEIAKHDGPLLVWDKEGKRHNFDQKLIEEHFPDKESAKYRKFKMVVDAMAYLEAPNPRSRCSTTRYLKSDIEECIKENNGKPPKK
ncbi:MAG: hypothetical protein WCJ33_04000, partial [Pseudomonadota bacterium]